ncbi:MAG: SsrA-binding protein [Candidatus Goldiibacteriota bacterium HGW-Goldbacteria-1]|jgi:SsrA-binding protein|nr:MAG: SsrA-binding protein [Candidatus Goldiibacteriota bacterium HGW-Goldbacteria-1]
MTESTASARNRKAFHNYEIMEKYEAGIALKGTEVKSIRDGRINLQDGFVRLIKGELIMMNVHISPYSHGNINNHSEIRDRKLLMHRQEIDRIAGKLSKAGLTIVPLAVYFKKGKAKVEIGIAKGKQAYDKRESIKKRDIQREEARYKINL